MEDKRNTIQGNILWALALMRLNWLAAKEYKASFLIQIIGMAINNIAFIIAWYFVFKIFGDIKGWGFEELFALNGITSFAYGIINFFGQGIPQISRKVTQGNIDRFLISPKNILANIAMSESGISAIGDIIFGIISITIYFIISGIPYINILALPIVLSLTIIIYSGYLILTQSIVFWIPNSEELSNAMHHFMLGPALYPNKAFDGIIRTIYTFLIPSILISTIPVEILSTLDIRTIFFLLIMSVFWLTSSIFVFYKGLKRYESGNLVGTR